MDIERIKEFTILAKEESLRSSAKKLGLSAATLSARLIAFEKSLGTPLFSRENNSLKLNEAGKLFYPKAIQIVNTYENTLADLADSDAAKCDQLTIAISGSDIPPHLGPCLDLLNFHNPNVKLTFMEDNVYDVSEGLLSGAIDLYFGHCINKISYEGIIKQAVSSPHQSIILPDTHPLARESSLRLSQLDGETFLIFPNSKTSFLRDFQLENLKASGISYHTYELNAVSRFNHFLVPIGKGILLNPFYKVDEPPHSSVISVVDLPHPAPMTLFYSRERTHPGAALFIKKYLAFAKERKRHDNRPAP